MISKNNYLNLKNIKLFNKIRISIIILIVIETFGSMIHQFLSNNSNIKWTKVYLNANTALITVISLLLTFYFIASLNYYKKIWKFIFGFCILVYNPVTIAHLKHLISYLITSKVSTDLNIDFFYGTLCVSSLLPLLKSSVLFLSLLSQFEDYIGRPRKRIHIIIFCLLMSIIITFTTSLAPLVYWNQKAQSNLDKSTLFKGSPTTHHQ